MGHFYQTRPVQNPGTRIGDEGVGIDTATPNTKEPHSWNKMCGDHGGEQLDSSRYQKPVPLVEPRARSVPDSGFGGRVAGAQYPKLVPHTGFSAIREISTGYQGQK
eukprot:3291839-Rhodomonas_salina.4